MHIGPPAWPIQSSACISGPETGPSTTRCASLPSTAIAAATAASQLITNGAGDELPSLAISQMPGGLSQSGAGSSATGEASGVGAGVGDAAADAAAVSGGDGAGEHAARTGVAAMVVMPSLSRVRTGFMTI